MHIHNPKTATVYVKGHVYISEHVSCYASVLGQVAPPFPSLNARVLLPVVLVFFEFRTAVHDNSHTTALSNHDFARVCEWTPINNYH